MTAHRHAKMIKAKADNMELVVFEKDPSGWLMKISDIIHMNPSKEYFLCLPQHKEVCLHWLNGGTISDVSKATDWYMDENGLKNVVWSDNSIFMSEDYNLSIKPRKEKRWIAINIKNHEVCLCHEEDKPPFGYQIVEIEVEV